MPLDEDTTVGLSLIRFGVDDILDTTKLIDQQGAVNYDRINLFSAADYALTFSFAKKLPITGFDLQNMGIKPGPIYADIMKAITEAWYENPNISKEQATEIAKQVAKI